VYPPSAFVPLAPIGLLPHPVAVGLWLALLAVAAFAALRLLGVRDPRLYGLWLLTPMLLSTAAIGNATVLVVLLCALVWRYRDRAGVAGVALAAAVALKLFAAPLGIWLLAQRRYRAAGVAAGATAVLIFGAWACIGFTGLGQYTSILRTNRDVFGADGPFLQGLVLQAGGSSRAALAAGIVVAAALLSAAAFARDVTSFALAAAAAVILAPVAWIGYLALLGIPLAALWRRLSRAWLVLLLGGYAHWYYAPLDYRSAGLSVFTLALTAAVLALIGVEDRRRSLA
jgi:alpha-1,2-mannosyltransferase